MKEALLVLVSALGVGLLLGIGVFLATQKAPLNCTTGFHESYPTATSTYDAAYQNAPEPARAISGIKGLEVNHHLLAASLIAETLKYGASSAVTRVVLFSPNHFGVGHAPAITSLYNWHTPYGTVHSDCGSITDLSDRGFLSIDEEPFENEHGITGLMPFIKKIFPNAAVVPIVVADSLRDADQKLLAEALVREYGSQTLYINSVDFSHYLTSTAAEFHDQTSLAVIKNFDTASVRHLDINSKAGTGAFLAVMSLLGAHHFDVIAHMNSAEYTESPALDQTTSYINGVFSSGAVDQTKTATMLLFGDVLLDREVRKKMDAEGLEYPFAALARLLRGQDVTVANAEGVFSDRQSVATSSTSALLFAFSKASLPVLKKLGFTHLSQANNHALNFGSEALNESQRAITDAGIVALGDPQNEAPGPYSVTIRGITVSFVAYNQFTSESAERVHSAIRAAHAAKDFVVVYPHWGEEYNPAATPFQREEAHGFIDEGADLVVGAHPHVIEPIEVYKGKAIFYSLGNFIFDQGSAGPTAEGLSIGVVVKSDSVAYYLMPIAIVRAQASLMSYEPRTTLLETMSNSAIGTDEALRAQIKNGIMTLALTPPL